MTSAMSTVYDMSQHEAVATSLAVMVLTGLCDIIRERMCMAAALFIGGSCTAAMAGASQLIVPHVLEPDMRKIFAAVLAFFISPNAYVRKLLIANTLISHRCWSTLLAGWFR